MNRLLVATGVSIALAVALIASPAGATKHQRHKKAPAGISVSAAGKQYLADVAPVNAATDTAKSAFDAATTAPQLAAAAAPLVASIETLNSTMLRQQWPSVAKADVKSLVIAAGAELGDLNSLATINDSNASTIETNLSKDIAATGTAANIVRADLGLPAPAAG
jgi:hypothetical protein